MLFSYSLATYIIHLLVHNTSMTPILRKTCRISTEKWHVSTEKLDFYTEKLRIFAEKGWATVVSSNSFVLCPYFINTFKYTILSIYNEYICIVTSDHIWPFRSRNTWDFRDYLGLFGMSCLWRQVLKPADTRVSLLEENRVECSVVTLEDDFISLWKLCCFSLFSSFYIV